MAQDKMLRSVEGALKQKEWKGRGLLVSGVMQGFACKVSLLCIFFLTAC